MPILAKKKIIFSDGAYLGGYVNKQNYRIWGTENPHAYKRATVCCGFWFRGIIGPFCFENEQGEGVTVNTDHCWTNFCSQELKRRMLAIAAELMSFGHLGVAIWHRWTIICGDAVKGMCYAPTSQRQLTIFVKPLVKYSCTQYIMCLKIGPIV